MQRTQGDVLSLTHNVSQFKLPTNFIIWRAVTAAQLHYYIINCITAVLHFCNVALLHCCIIYQQSVQQSVCRSSLLCHVPCLVLLILILILMGYGVYYLD